MDVGIGERAMISRVSAFLGQRIFRSMITLLIAVTIVFFLLRTAGDPASILLPPETPGDVKDAYRTLWGLDRSLFEQYVDYLIAIIHGDLGISFADSRPATTIVLQALPKSLLLGGTALSIGLCLGLPLGVFAAMKHNTLIDRAVMAVAISGYAIPVFFLGILLILEFSLRLRWLPSAGSATWAHLVLPAFTLGLPLSGRIARFSRTAALEVLGRPYIRTAKAKGLGQFMVLSRHAAPNAAVPVLMFLGIEIGSILSGGAVTESIFGWPGLGRLLVDSAYNRDLPVVQSAILCATLIMVLANFFVDLMHFGIDPRLSISGTTSK